MAVKPDVILKRVLTRAGAIFRNYVLRRLRAFRYSTSRWLGLDHSIGCIDSIEGHVLRGWYIPRYKGASESQFHVLLDERELGTFSATLMREDLQALEGVLRCGFAVDLSSPLRALLTDAGRWAAGTHNLTLRSPNGRLVARREVAVDAQVAGLVDARGKVSRVREVLAGASTQGYLDRLDDTGLAGWALDAGRPNEPVELAVLVNDTQMMSVQTFFSRGDLLAKGMPGKCAGFRLQWRAGVLPAGTTVDVRFASTGQSLAKSPRRVAGRHHPGHLAFMGAYRSANILPATIIVPIHNAFDAVSSCLDALLQHTARDAEILLIDDGSTDARMAGLLERGAAASSRCRIVLNGQNLGYTRTINKALSLCAGHDVILLNSDTVVTPRWLENLRYCAYSASNVATVTALSDNAGAFSAPEIGMENVIPDGTDALEFARTVVAAGLGRQLDVPTGNGFCIYIRRQALDSIGSFDEEKFPRGYGEENDWCMRALRAGWTHLVSDKVYIFHKRSQSFGEQKQALLMAGSARLHADYPEYRLLTQRFSDIEFSYVRHRIRVALAKREEDAGLPTILFVISTETGGTPQTNLDLMRALRGHYRCLLLSSNANSLRLSKLRADGSLAVVETASLETPIEPITHRSAEYDRIVADMMYRHSIELLHIRHIAWHGLGLVDAAKALGLPVFFSVHDFYSICPSLKLVDENLVHCGGRCTAGEGVCQIELWPVGSVPPLKHRFVHRWQQMFHEAFGRCDRFISTSLSARALFLEKYPEAESRFEVIPHGRDFHLPERLAAPRRADGPFRILILGNISPPKGGVLLRDTIEICTDGNIEFHFLGEVWTGLAGRGIQHGRYPRDELESRVREIEPHLGLVLSVWPETYCHTLTELWMLGIPVLGLDIGAIGDRIRASGGGWLLAPQVSAQELLEKIHKIAAAPSDIDGKLEAVYAWQRTEGTQNTTARMAAAYARLYQQAIAPPSHGIECGAGPIQADGSLA